MVKKQTVGPSLPGPTNIWGGGQLPGGGGDLANTETFPQPQRATEGSAGLDLHSTTRLVLTPQMATQVIETNFKGPLEKDTVGLLFGCSSSALHGFIIHPGVIDPDYQGVVKVMVSSP
jgi:dUTPase